MGHLGGRASRASVVGAGGPRFESRRRRFSFASDEKEKNRRSLALSQNGWMDARARNRAHSQRSRSTMRE